MIELPDFAVPASMDPVFLDAGFTQRGAQSLTRIDRKGGRYKVAFTFPPYLGDEARAMVARLIAGKQEGLRVRLPVLHGQGAPGSPLIAAAVATGRQITLKNVTPGYRCKEGFWLSIKRGEQHFLHNVRTGGMAAADGTLSIALNEMVRAEFELNDEVHLADPMIEGIVEGDEAAWNVARSRIVPISFAIEEAR